MERVNNPEVKKCLKKFVIETLNECQLFTEVYGKSFAKKKLQFLNKVYTNEKNYKFGGMCSYTGRNITLYLEGPNGSLLSANDFLTNKQYRQIALHEAIHLILTRNKLLGSSGMHEFYINGNELGRGLNEGLTEWICEKASYPSKAYFELKCFIKQLELAIGEKKVMKLGKGNIKRNISKQLGMSQQECKAFLALADEIYELHYEVTDLEHIIDLLEKKKHCKSDEEEKLLNDELENIEEYRNVKNSTEDISEINRYI